MYEAFLKIFAIKNMQDEIVFCVKDFESLGESNYKAVNRVVKYLQQTGLTVLGSVEKILITTGIYHYPRLGKF